MRFSFTLLLLMPMLLPFHHGALAFYATPSVSMQHQTSPSQTRRTVLSAGLFGGVFGGGSSSPPPAYGKVASKGPTNEVVKVVNGIKHKRLGGSDIIVSEIGLGTQRWVSTDFNAPNEETCFEFMDQAILKGGVNLIDTAEQYPIPTDGMRAREGDTETVIGKWIKDRKVPRSDVVIATKITGGRNVTPKNIKADCEGSLKRLQSDYIDVYQLHWPQRYSPQSNWGQSLAYDLDNDRSPYWRGMGGPTSFEELCTAMQGLIEDGKIRGWGLCNDNAYGLTACTRTAKALGTTPPCSIQGDFSLIDRKVRLWTILTWWCNHSRVATMLLADSSVSSVERRKWRGGSSFTIQ